MLLCTKKIFNKISHLAYGGRFASKKTLPEIKKINEIPSSFLKKQITPLEKKKDNFSQDDLKMEMQKWEKDQQKNMDLLKATEGKIGLEVFETSLANSDKYKDISIYGGKTPYFIKLEKLIMERNAVVPIKEEYKYEITPLHEMLYKDVVYYRRHYRYHRELSLDKFTTLYRPPPKKVAIRNYMKHSQQYREFADALVPEIPKYPGNVATPIGTYMDPYKWFHDPNHQSRVMIKQQEDLYSEAVSTQFQTLCGVIYKELEKYNVSQPKIKVPLGDYNYFKGNFSDEIMALYREKEGPINPSELVFSLEDVYNMYKEYSEKYPAVKQFAEALKSTLEDSNHDPILRFYSDIEDKYLALVLNMSEPNSE